jgi:hypothetical protein
MNAKELRLGNFVFDNENIPMQIAKLETEKYTNWNSGNTVNAILEKDGQYYESDIMNYIPLTEQWLLDFGFEISYSSNFRLRFDYNKNTKFGFDYSHTADKSIEGFRYIGTYIKCDYVHQLQNLYFALCGEELTLNK